MAATARVPEPRRGDSRSPSATVAATVRSEYRGHFVSVDVALRRERSRGMWRQIFEKARETLERNGGDDGARTRDLRRDRPAVTGEESQTVKSLCSGWRLSS